MAISVQKSIHKILSRYEETDVYIYKGSLSQKSPDFLTLNIEELEAVLKADRLNVRHEVDVLNAISRWVVDNPTGRTGKG